MNLLSDKHTIIILMYNVRIGGIGRDNLLEEWSNEKVIVDSKKITC